MKIVTYNMRCIWDGSDGVNSFLHRAYMVYEKLSAEKPDIVSFQEVREEHAAYLEKMFPEYLLIGHGRLEDYSGEGVYTAIRRETMMLSASEITWLSETPYLPASRFPEQSECPRVVLMTLVRERASGRMIRVYNLHLDHISENARRLGMQCVLDRVTEEQKKFPTETVILGDFNARPDSVAIELCRAYPLVDLTDKIEATFHGFGTRDPEIKIDYIFASEKLASAMVSCEAWTECKHGIWLSDHYPVSAVFH